ncbi:hypothetical protein, partial [Pelagicoccus mobilis]|uniref:hypothetical protein n=1 Tax=Pelagicoccus mobilis TaxID=415221 RepID=UPI0035EC3271
RWRRLWRQGIQDHLIAAVQNMKILVSAAGKDSDRAACSLLAIELAGALEPARVLVARALSRLEAFEGSISPASARVSLSL